MDPAIRKFPSDQFYSGKLTDDESVSTRQLEPALMSLKTNLGLKSTMFFDLCFSSESMSEKSRNNRDEVEFICKLLKTMAISHVSRSLKYLAGRIGVISPYQS